jgi:hypothetical protein
MQKEKAIVLLKTRPANHMRNYFTLTTQTRLSARQPNTEKCEEKIRMTEDKNLN